MRSCAAQLTSPAVTLQNLPPQLVVLFAIEITGTSSKVMKVATARPERSALLSVDWSTLRCLVAAAP